MHSPTFSRRRFVTVAEALATVGVADATHLGRGLLPSPLPPQYGPVDYTLHIKVPLIEIAPKRIVSATTYNGQFPGPLLRFKEGRQVIVDIYNDTDTPEQLHWHGQKGFSRC